MRHYRIKIVELNNGSKEHIPQVSEFHKIFRNFEWSWENIITDRCDQNGIYFFKTSTNITEYYSIEENASRVIDEYKKHMERMDGKNVKSVSYKTIN